MARIAGIVLHKTPTGKLKSVTIDLKKHGENLLPYLEKIGAIEVEEDRMTKAEIIAFEQELKKGITSKEFSRKAKEHVDKVWNKYKKINESTFYQCSTGFFLRFIRITFRKILFQRSRKCVSIY